VITPAQYAARYLPVTFRVADRDYSINISRYHLGAETPAKDRLLGALADHLAREQSDGGDFYLAVYINSEPLQIYTWGDVSLNLYRPFIGKGSPEECQLVLQLALIVGGVQPNQLQKWADDNLGLDCNGFVGNYLFHELMGNDWQDEPTGAQPGPSALINTIFHWVSGDDENAVVDDLGDVSPHVSYLIARVDSFGNVMPGGPNKPVGHIAITEPGQIMKQSFVSNSMGGIDPEFVRLDMYNHLAVRTVESAGPRNVDLGVGMNWMVFLAQDPHNKSVFQVRRDKIHMLDRVKIAPISKLFP
jgi:hypothetical protein